MPAISQTFNFKADINVGDPDRQLRNAIEADTVRGLRETIDRLPLKPLGDGHTYAPLPDGTNIVVMKDGSIRLAIPKQIAATSTAPPSTASVALSKRPPDGS